MGRGGSYLTVTMGFESSYKLLFLVDDLWRFWQSKRAMGLDVHIYSCILEDTHDGCG